MIFFKFDKLKGLEDSNNVFIDNNKNLFLLNVSHDLKELFLFNILKS